MELATRRYIGITPQRLIRPRSLENRVMAKNTAKPTGTSRIKFIMLDAEIADDQIQSVTQAIANALRPATPPAPKRLPAAAAQLNGNGHAEEQDQSDLFETLEEEEPIDITPAAQSAKPRAKRSPPKSPSVVPMDMHAPISLATFAQGKDSKTQVNKYMIASAWLKECRGIDAVNGDHMFTCFKSMGWSTNIPDFTQPLRVLKAKNKYFDKTDKGYEINHIGLDLVNKLGGSNGAA
jgi:hypothetical protein